MLYDNEKRIVHDWITRYTREGNLDVVTGYFSVGALSFLADHLNIKTGKFRFILQEGFWKAIMQNIHRGFQEKGKLYYPYL
jgi:hypothetical protein